MIGSEAFFARAGGKIVDHELDRIEHRDAPRRAGVQVVAHAILEHAHVDPGIRFRDADTLREKLEAFGREAASPGADERRHSRIVPAVDVSLFDELDESPLGKDDIGEVEPRELVLPRQWTLELPSVGKLLDDPVVKRAMILELERADRMRDPLERVADAVRIVVQRIHAPLVAGPVMPRVPDPIDRRIAHVDVGARHVDLEPQHVCAVGKLPRAHAPK